MIGNKTKILITIFSVTVMLAPLVVFAFKTALPVNPGLPETIAGTDPSDFQAVVTRVIGMLLGIFGSVALLVIIWAGFRYLTSGGNAQRAEAAKKTFLNALIGFVIVLLAFVILRVIETLIIRGT
jgi:hypothetical protein